MKKYFTRQGFLYYFFIATSIVFSHYWGITHHDILGKIVLFISILIIGQMVMDYQKFLLVKELFDLDI